MLIGSACLQIPSILSHVFKTGWSSELLNFFFSSGGQGLEIAEDYMWTELGGLRKILCKQHCSSKSNTKPCTSVCPYCTNRIWTPLMCLRNKLFSDKWFINTVKRKVQNTKGNETLLNHCVGGSLEEEWEMEVIYSCVWLRVVVLS